MAATRIMVIDNDDTIRDMFDFMLGDEGYETFPYRFADASLDVVQAVHPDLIILDLNVVQGGMGWSFLQLLKMEDKTAAIPMLVCTTATRLSLDIEGYLAARHIAIVRKPFDLASFLLVVRQAFVPVNGMPFPRRLPILLIEDEIELQTAISTILQLEGYQVENAANGLIALDAVLHGQYSVIILDIAMPVMDGREFLAAYALQSGEYSPIIVYSAGPALMTEIFPSFVMDRLSKPFEVDELLRLISKYAQPVPGTSGYGFVQET